MSGQRFALGSSDITPREPGPLAGFAARTGPARGTLDRLSVRALLLADDEQEVALVALDLLGVPDGLLAMIGARMPGGPRLILCATHTHAGPPVLARAALGEVPAGYPEEVADRTADLLRDLRARLLRGALRHSKVPTDGIAHNRRMAGGPVDPFVDAVELWTEAGELAGLWLNFACHPVVLGPNNLRYSADFPGAARAQLEARLGVPVVYTTGCAGQINTGHDAMDSIRLKGLERRTPEEVLRIGERLADAVENALGSRPPPIAAGAVLAYRERTLEADMATVGAAERARIEARARAALVDPASGPGERAMAEIDLRWLTLRPYPVRLSVSALRAGPLLAAFLPGEVFVETALAVQASHSGAAVIGYAHSNPGYIPHASALAQGGYEVDVAYRPYGLPGPFAPGTAERLERAATELLAEIA